MNHFHETDRDIVRLLLEYRRLDSFQVERLTKRNERSIRRRLKGLTDAGLLVRRTPPLELDRPVNAPLGGYTYFVSARGHRKAREWGLVNGQPFIEPPVSVQNLNHDLTVSDFHMHLQEAADKRAIKVPLWIEGRARLLDHVSWRGETLTVNPDGLFAIVSPEGTAFYFLEVEKSRGEAYRKLRAYFEYRDQEAYRKRWPQMEDFRLVFTFPNEERLDNFLAKASAEGFPYRMFFATTEASYQADMLGSIFRTPKDPDRASYSLLQ